MEAWKKCSTNPSVLAIVSIGKHNSGREAIDIYELEKKVKANYTAHQPSLKNTKMGTGIWKSTLRREVQTGSVLWLSSSVKLILMDINMLYNLEFAIDHITYDLRQDPFKFNDS